MKYKILLKTLTALIYLKRSLWWSGRQLAANLNKIFGPVIKVTGYVLYKAEFLVGKKLGLNTGLNRKFFKRDNLQVVLLIMLFFLAIPQTKLYSKTANTLPGQNTIAYTLVGSKDVLGELEEVKADSSAYSKVSKASQWKQGAVSSDDFVAIDYLQHNQELAATVVAGGTAVSKPIVFPGTFVGGAKRTEIIEHKVQDGETISAIALRYGVSAATILWENDLSSWSFIRPGDTLTILPVSGIRHKVKSGDNLIKIAKIYGGTIEEIVKFNTLKTDGSDIRIGERLIIPDGVKHYQPTVTVAARTTPSYSTVKVPASSASAPSASGFVWPSAMRTITQYYWWAHRAIDVSGSIGKAHGSAIYASKSGTIEKAQCGWNMGYGCYVVINHGGGYKTLYGHNSRLLVKPGDYVSTGQTIALMGNTGKVRGATGTHLHFEIIVNGWRVNPLGYVR